jgi:hypothetical protein
VHFAKRLLMVSGAVAFAAVVGAIVTPKATHAVISTLVQMTNTVGNPGVTEDISKASSSIVDLICPTPSIGLCQQVLPGGNIGTGTYTVPANQKLVITSIDFEPYTLPGGLGLAATPSNGPGVSVLTLARACPMGFGILESFNDQWLVSNAAGTSLQFPTAGIVVDSGCQLRQADFANFTFLVRGYLTSN